MGRPSSYDPAIAEEICIRIAQGASVATACEGEDMPVDRTVYRWLSQHDDFSQKYARARLSRADARFESVDEILVEMRAGRLSPEQSRVAIDAIKWQCGKEAPSKYGDRPAVAVNIDMRAELEKQLEQIAFGGDQKLIEAWRAGEPKEGEK
jgi:hypothetical protein